MTEKLQCSCGISFIKSVSIAPGSFLSSIRDGAKRAHGYPRPRLHSNRRHSQNDVRGFPAHPRQRVQIVHGLRHFAAMCSHQIRATCPDILSLRAKEPVDRMIPSSSSGAIARNPPHFEARNNSLVTMFTRLSVHCALRESWRSASAEDWQNRARNARQDRHGQISPSLPGRALLAACVSPLPPRRVAPVSLGSAGRSPAFNALGAPAPLPHTPESGYFRMICWIVTCIARFLRCCS